VTSRTAYDQIEDKLPFGYEYLGEKTAKNIFKPLGVYRVLFGPEEETPGADKAEHERRSARYEKIKDEIKKRRTKHAERDTPSEREIKGTGARSRIHHSRLSHRNLRAYVVVICFLFIINMLTWHGKIWFHWPALGLGLLFFLRWAKGSDASSRREP
jgi:hypothetical protein